MATEQAFDVIVVGAGPGGSAAAIAALRERPDARVLLLDRSPLGRDKVCGDGVGPDSVAELAGLGIAHVLRPVEGSGSADPRKSKASLTSRAAELLPGFAVESTQMSGHLRLLVDDHASAYVQSGRLRR